MVYWSNPEAYWFDDYTKLVDEGAGRGGVDGLIGRSQDSLFRFPVDIILFSETQILVIRRGRPTFAIGNLDSDFLDIIQCVVDLPVIEFSVEYQDLYFVRCCQGGTETGITSGSIAEDKRCFA